MKNAKNSTPLELLFTDESRKQIFALRCERHPLQQFYSNKSATSVNISLIQWIHYHFRCLIASQAFTRHRRLKISTIECEHLKVFHRSKTVLTSSKYGRGERTRDMPMNSCRKQTTRILNVAMPCSPVVSFDVKGEIRQRKKMFLIHESDSGAVVFHH